MPITDTYNRSPLRGEPVRQASWRVRAVALFGGDLQQFGWLSMALASALMWVFLPKTDVSFWKYQGDMIEVSAVVVSCTDTRAKETESSVYEVVSQFEDAGGRLHTDKSYVTGQRFREGEAVRVEYVAGTPTTSRLVGGRKEHFTAWLSLVSLVFPVVGLILILPGLRRGIACQPLLAHGHLAHATLVSSEKTKVEVNDKPIYKVRFEFEVDGRKYFASAKSNNPDLVAHGMRKSVFYNPRNPARNFAVGTLPDLIAVGPEGEFKVPSFGEACLAVLLPSVTFAVNLMCAYFVLRG